MREGKLTAGLHFMDFDSIAIQKVTAVVDANVFTHQAQTNDTVTWKRRIISATKNQK